MNKKEEIKEFGMEIEALKQGLRDSAVTIFGSVSSEVEFDNRSKTFTVKTEQKHFSLDDLINFKNMTHCTAPHIAFLESNGRTNKAEIAIVVTFSHLR